MGSTQWEIKPLKELCSTIGDGLHGTPKYVDNSEYYFVNGNNLKNGFITITENTRKVDFDEFEKYYLEFDENTLLMSINGTLGNLALYRNEQVILGKSAAYINCKSINRKFLYYYLQLDNIQKRMWDEATGSTIKNLSLDSLKNFPIPTPDLITQQKIAAVLSALDAKIELNQRINAELEQMAKTLYDYWFVQFDFPNEKGKPYKSADGKMVWNEALKREIPFGWTDGVIADLADVIDPHPSHRAPVEVKEGFPFAGIGDIDKDGNINLSKARVINEDFVNKQESDYEITYNSIGYGRVGTVGKVVKLRRQKFRYALSPTLSIINTKDVRHQSFVYFTVNDKNFYNKVLRKTSGSTRPAIGIQELRKIPVVIVPEKSSSILREFERVASNCIRQSEILNKESQTLTELRDWLLPMLMNGQVVVNGSPSAKRMHG